MTLKDLRRRAAMEQREVAARLGVSVQTVSSWEIGRRSPKPQHIRELAALFDTGIVQIVDAITRTKMARTVATSARRGAEDSTAAPLSA